MLAASQDIDSFIERQRSQLNKQGARQPSNRPPPPQLQQQQPPPLPVQSSHPPTNVHDRLDFKVARILDEPPPRVQSYYRSNSPPPPPVAEPSGQYYGERQDFRRPSNELLDDHTPTFFNKFGTYEDKRTQLKDDLKREYNEFLQAKKQVPKSKSTSQISPRGNNNNNRRVQFQSNGKVVAPWEKGDKKSNGNVQSMEDISFNANSYSSSSRSRPQVVRNDDQQYVRDREAYIGELHEQIRELEARKRELEMQSSKLSAGPGSNVTRSHYKEDLNALNSLLAERLDQRNAVDFELAHILNRPPVSTSPTRLGSGNMPMMMNNVPMQQQSNNGPYPSTNQRQGGPPGNRPDPRARPGDGFQIGHEVDKDSEQAAKKRYQQELQAQMREAQMRKAQAKREKDEYDRKLDAEIQKYNYFGRSGGGAPMRDRDGNVVANLADLRNPANPQQQMPPPPGQSPYSMPDEKVYSLGNAPSSILNAPFYNGEHQQSSYPSNTDRPGSPNHARGAVSNGIFGAAKTEEQFAREEKYKQELKKQIDEKRQREVEEAARRRAEEERELAKHLEWQQQMERQTAEEASRKQEKENQDRLQHQQRQEELERQKQAEEAAARRKPKRVEKPMTPKRETSDDYPQRQNTYDEPDQQQPPPATEAAFRSSSPPIPALKNKGKKTKAKAAPVQPPSFDDDNGEPPMNSPPPLPPLTTNDDYMQQNTPTPPANAMRVSHGQQTYRKPPTPGQPDVTSARKKPPPAQTQQTRARPSSNTGMAIRTNSALSLRSDGSDSEVLNRLEHLKRQLKDKEARLQDHVIRHQTDTTHTSQVHETTKTTYQPPTSRKQSPGFLLNAARMHHRDSPTNNDRARRLLQTDDDFDFKPSYFRDDAILMSDATATGTTGQDYYPSKRIDSADRLFDTKIEREANQRKYGFDSNNYYDREDPTAIANYELNRIAEQNEQRLKKLRDLEHDDVSLLDSNEVLERFQQRQRLQRGGSQTTLQDDTWLK